MSEPKPEGRQKLPAKFIKKIQGKDFVLFEGLLEMAHAAGLKRVETQLLQAPHRDNAMLAIVRAVVETDKGVFSALGDASPESAERPMQPHLVRLADTRAIARALRLATNVGMTAAEEINQSEPVIGANGNGQKKSSAPEVAEAAGAPEARSANEGADGEATKSKWLQEPELQPGGRKAWMEKPESVILSFGKHADKSLGDVLIEDPTYVEWLAKEAYDYVLRTAAKKLLEESTPQVDEFDPTGTAEIFFE
ncbi:MAG: exodeoxyribonuclease X C-terminal domain-containing protein [Candidatus Aquicultor sp.]